MGRLVWDDAPEGLTVEAVDLLTGEPAGVTVRRDGKRLVVDDVAIGGSPVAIRWRADV